MATTVKDIYNKLKTTIVGTSTSDIDSKLDAVSKDIVSYRTQINRNNTIELVKNLIAKTGYNLPSGVGTSSSAFNPSALGQGGRIQRYKMYESITSNINYCHRALQVLVDNILSPDDITKTSLDIKSASFIDDDKNLEANSRNVRELIEKLKLEKNLDIIVKNTLQLGDFFSEIADDRTALTSKSAILTESTYLSGLPLEYKDTFSISLKEHSSDKINVTMDYSTYTEDFINNDKSKDPVIKIENLHLLFYDPKRVVKLQSTMFPVCFGYLVFPATVLFPQLAVQDQLVNNICSGILGSLEKKIPNLKSSTVDIDDLKNILRFMIRESDPSRSMNIRYVPPDKMIHFHIPSTKYFPYGESIFDSCQFTSKVLMTLETALTLHRLNRSIEKRKISVEIGLPRDARKSIELLKEEFKKRKYNLDSFGSIDSIPSMVSSFEDIYIPQKDGKSFVDISPFSDAGADTRGKVDELKFIRDSIIASLGVPPAFIGLEENLSNKAALAEENILFARTIVNHQKYLSSQIQELILKVYQIIDPDKALTVMDDVIVAFPIPRSLQYERESKYLGDLANLIQTLETIGIPREWAKKKYLTSIDWDEVRKHETDAKIDQNLKLPSPDEIASMAGGLSSMGGLGSMGMGGMGGGMAPI